MWDTLKLAEMTIIESIMTVKPKPHKVAFILFDGCVIADFAGPSELLNRVQLAQEAAAYEVQICAPNKSACTPFCTLQTVHDWDVAADADTLVVPGTSDIHSVVSTELKTLLLEAHQRGKRILSICTGAFVLAASGLLDGHRATTHWAAAEQLQARYPQISVDPNVLFVRQGKVYTSAGASAGLDLILHIIKQDCGANVAAHIAKLAVVPLEREGGQAQFIEPDSSRIMAGSMQPLLEWIEQHLDQAISVDTLADRLAVSPRTLHRYFIKRIGLPPAAYLIQARLKKARILLESSRLSVEQIAASTGFGSAINFRQQFRKHLQISPREYRKSFKVV